MVKRKLPRHPKVGEEYTIRVRGRKVTFLAVKKEGFGMWRIVSNVPARGGMRGGGKINKRSKKLAKLKELEAQLRDAEEYADEDTRDELKYEVRSLRAELFGEGHLKYMARQPKGKRMKKKKRPLLRGRLEPIQLPMRGEKTFSSKENWRLIKQLKGKVSQ